MAADNKRREISANEMLSETAVNLFSEKTQVVKNLLKSNKKIFSKNVLNQSLLSCCRNGNVLLMPAIITAGVDLEVTDENGNTPLSLCAFNSHENCARLLLGAGVNVNAINYDGNTPLIESVCICASIGVTKLLIVNKDIRIDHANKNGYTALLCAIESANLNAIKLLIDAGASSERNEAVHESCLNLETIASRKGLLNLVNLFKLQKDTGKSPLLLAALNRDLESAEMMTSMDDSILNTTNDSFESIMIQFLKSIQDNNNVVNQTEIEMFEFLLKHMTTITLSSSAKESIMDIAISLCNHTIVERLCKLDFVISNQNLSSAVSKPNILRLLLTNRHDINKLNSNNQPDYNDSALDIAMRCEEIDSAKILIQHGAYVNIDLALEAAVKSNQSMALCFIQTEFPAECRQKLKSPQLLHDAIKNSALNIIPLLLDSGADIHSSHNGKYGLTQAVDVNVLDLLLSRGADANVKIGSLFHSHPLHEFVSSDFRSTLKKKWTTLQASGVAEFFLISEIKDFVKCLIRHGANVNLRDWRGRTALHIAAQRDNSVGILNLLIDSGAKVNIQDGEEETPLFKAVEFEDIENIKCLIDAGADTNSVCDTTGESVIFRTTNETILELLLDNDADVDIIDFEGDTLLNSLLSKFEIAPTYVKRLIDAGCDVDKENDAGDTALTLAAKYVEIEILKHIVEASAGVKASTSKAPYITAVKTMFIKLWNHAECTISCINYLIDQYAKIDNVHSCVVHVFITSGCLSLIPRFISFGLAPTYLIIQRQGYAWNKSTTNISPLMMALLLNQSDLVQYFIQINYLMKPDISILSGNKIVQEHLKSEYILNSLDLLNTVSRQPMSLETLCSVILSDILGSTQGRRSRVQKLGLPQPLQDLLLFKNVTENDIKNTGTRSLFLFKQSLKQSDLCMLFTDDEDEDDSDFNSDFNSDDDDF